MQVKDLIEQLQKIDPEMLVCRPVLGAPYNATIHRIYIQPIRDFVEKDPNREILILD